MSFRFFLLLPVVLIAACGRQQTDDPAPTPDNAELKQLFERDQAVRENGFVDLNDIEAVSRMIREDSLRRVQVEAIIEAGELHTAEDYYRAAMIFQHGDDTTAYRRAHALARQAVALDSTHPHAKWLTAAAWDRYLMEQGKPQWDGSQYTRQSGEAWKLYEVDTTRVTDAERRRLGVPTLQEARAQADSMNAQLERQQR